MIAALPSAVSDTGAVIGIIAALTVVLAAVSAFVVFIVRKIVQPKLDDFHALLQDHMQREDLVMERIALALELIESKLGLNLPAIRVSGGSDEGDPEEH